jgi:acetyltransferase-like isoleucine patch superfamily enzyme
MRLLTNFLLLLFKLPGWLAAKLYNFTLLHSVNIRYESYPVIFGRLVLKGKGKIILGTDVRINSSLSSNPVGLTTRTVIFAYPDAIIQIGNNVGISNSLICAMQSITIEDNVWLGGGAQVFDTDFHSIEYLKRLESPDTNIRNAPVRIKHGAFIGCNSIILKGVVIGARSIVAAGSVVVKDIPDDQIWGGNPARFIKVIDNKHDDGKK